jgi:hypothetical protein
VAAGTVVRTAGRYSIAAGTLTVMAADRRIMIFGGEAALPGGGTGSRIGRKTEQGHAWGLQSSPLAMTGLSGP